MDFSKVNLTDNQDLARLIIFEASKKEFKRRGDFERLRNSIIKQHKGKIFHNLYFVRAYKDLLREGLIQVNDSLLNIIQKRGVRTLSGVAPVTVMTKPFPCPGRCIYCPTDVRMPKSYLTSQPAAQRGFRQRFNPYTQVFVRLKALLMTGHEVSKVELRILGGTWSSYPKKYQNWFVKMCLLAMNEFTKQIADTRTDNMANLVKKQEVKSVYGVEEVNTVKIKPLSDGARFSLAQVVKANETADVRCIGINIETRPDFLDVAEIKRLRRLGVTKIEMGVQTTDDTVQEITERGHDLAEVRRATALIRDAGFKISYHMMPNLPGTTVDLDKRMIGDLFKDSSYRPDYLKIYPCVVLPKAKLSIWFRQGRFKPYEDRVLEEILLQNLRDVPEYCRIDRIARDIPANEIESGFKVSNIRQILEKRLKDEGTPLRDIRAREVAGEKIDPEKVVFVDRGYEAGSGFERFLAFEEPELDKLVALLRLRLPWKKGRGLGIAELRNAALIREVHVYGRQIAVGVRKNGEKQHIGWGRRLMFEAERIAKQEGYEKVAVIAGIGTREYYAKLGYGLVGTYMVKSL